MFHFRKFRVMAILLMLTLLTGQGEQVFAEGTSKQVEVYFVPMHFVFDAKELAPPGDQVGFIYKDRTYVPLRFIAYALNKTVQWDGETYSVSISEPNEQERASIDAYKLHREVANGKLEEVDESKLSTTAIEVEVDRITYLFDGESKQPSADLPGYIYKDRLYVPMRFMAESVGKTIEWDSKTYSVKASTVSVDDKQGTQGTSVPTVAPSATPTPSPSAAGGVGGAEGSTGAGGTGGAASKPSYELLKAPVDVSINALHDKAQTELSGLLEKYKSAAAADKPDLILQGLAKLAGYDAEFDAIMNSFEAQLIANGYDTAIIAQYRQDYANQKQEALGGY